MSASSARRVASNATLWLGRVASTAGRRLGGSGGSGRPASTLDDTNATPDTSSVDSSNESQTTSTTTPFFRPPAGFAICTDSGVAVPREVMLPMLNDFDWEKAKMHLQGTSEHAEVSRLQARISLSETVPHEEAVEIFNKLKAWHYSGHFTELIESVRTQSGKGRAVIATMLNEMETSMDELIEIKTEVAALIAEQRYDEAIELAQQGEQPFASMSVLLQQWKAGVEREQAKRDAEFWWQMGSTSVLSAGFAWMVLQGSASAAAQEIPRTIAAEASKGMFAEGAAGVGSSSGGAGMGLVMAGFACGAATMTAWTQTEECREYLDYFDRVCAAREVMHAQINSSIRRINLAVKQLARHKNQHQARFGDVLHQLADNTAVNNANGTKPAGWVMC